jgi:cell division protein FtsB
MQAMEELEGGKRSRKDMAADLQASKQQLAALRAENGALKQQKTLLSHKEQKAAEEALAAAEVGMACILWHHLEGSLM